MKKFALLFSLLMAVQSAWAGMVITEWMYQGQPDGSYEFVEFTNMSLATIDMTGWSFDDDARTPGAFDLTGFGLVLSGQSVILTEVAATAFRTAWGLGNDIKVLGQLGLTAGNNLGRGDEINLYDADNQLVDRLTYGDNVAGIGGPRTRYASGNILLENLGVNNASLAVLSEENDIFGSWESAGGDIANPGYYYAAVPEPATLSILGLGSLLIIKKRRKS